MLKKNQRCGRWTVLGLSLFVLLLPLAAQEKTNGSNDGEQKLINQRFEALDHRLDQLEKAVDDILWYNKVGDVALIDKVFQYGPPPANIKNPTAMGAQNPVKFWSYVFIPRGIDRNRKYPLLVLPHGGVHANFTTYHTHIIRELLAQGYVVVAPEYRGSTGYGKGFYETDRLRRTGSRRLSCQPRLHDRELRIHRRRPRRPDRLESRRPDRVDEHFRASRAITRWPLPACRSATWSCAWATRAPIIPGEYSADFHIGKTINENVMEYQRRSPVWHVKKLQTPLLIHTNTNDDDVYAIEVEHLIQALKAEG